MRRIETQGSRSACRKPYARQGGQEQDGPAFTGWNLDIVYGKGISARRLDH